MEDCPPTAADEGASPGREEMAVLRGSVNAQREGSEPTALHFTSLWDWM